jgi:methylated-DNA-[protein]-cysteine S-methyltransferase
VTTLSGSAQSAHIRLMEYRTITSPIGPLLLAADEAGVRFLLFANGRKSVAPRAEWEPDRGLLAEPVRQLNLYFAGKLRDFDLPVAPDGTPFQRSVWSELQRIPYGGTISYGELARRIGNAKAVRAVGLANGSNPISIIIPCHRVIGSNGSLTGYGGGLPTKQALLALERGQTSLL